MPSNLQAYRQMADHAQQQITGSHQSWMAFLQTAARLYKYPYNEQVMIHAQRPNATACAEYDFWNERMGRYVRRGSKGIAVIDTTGDNPKLKYVFDVADTGTRENSRSVNLWELRRSHNDTVSAMLEHNYGISGENGLQEQLEHVAAQLADEYWNEHSRDMLDIVADSFLEEYDNFNIGVQFRNAATVSITYALMSRCGLEPDDYFEHEDFLSVFDFNTPVTVSALGTAVSEINQQVLRQIEVAIRNYERVHSAERTDENGRTDLYQERRLPDSRSEPDTAAGDPAGQVRQDAEDVPEGAPSYSVESPDSLGDPVPASAGDRRDGEPALGADDAGVDEAERSNGGPESRRPNEVGGLNEQSESAGGGNDSRGADLQLNEPPAAGSVQLSFFPTEDEQIALIDEADEYNTYANVSVRPFAFSFTQADIDHVLRLGGNNDNSRQRVAAQYMMQKPTEEIAAFLSREYVGGGGFITDNSRMSAWFAEAGIHLAKGDSARYVQSAQVIPWEDATERIGQLLELGRFATNVELAETEGYTRDHLAQSLWYLKHDFDEPAKEQGYLSVMEDFRGGGFPDETARLSEALSHPEYCATITQEYEQFLTAYREDRGLLRFHYHHAGELLDRLYELALPCREYQTDMAEISATGHFITDDEINAALSGGSNVEGGKGRIYTHFTEKHTPKEQTDFLKNEYGIGGGNNAIPGSFLSNKDYSGKGIRLQKPDCANVELSWNNVAKRVSELVRKDRYLTPEEKTRYDELHAPQKPETAVTASYADYLSVKDAHADDVVLYQVGDFFEMYGADAETVEVVLELTPTTRTLEGERVPMCGIPVNRLEQYVNKLHDEGYDVTISGIEQLSGERRVFSLPSVDHAAERDIDTHEAESGADGTRVFSEAMPEHPTVQENLTQYKPVVIAAVSENTRYRNACGHSDHENAAIECNAAVRDAVLNSSDMELIRLYSDMPEFRSGLHQEVFDDTYPQLHALLRPLSQDDIDSALQNWNGDIASKRRVQDYMADHARGKDTAAWLAREYGGTDSKSLFIIRAGSPETLELPWAKVQRRIAQLVQEDRFFTEQELDDFDDIDTAAIREALNSPEAQERVDRMMEEAEKVAAESAPAPYERFAVVESENGWAIWDDLHNGYYIDDDDVSEEFTSRWQAEDYLKEVQKAVAEKDAADWLAVEQANVIPEVSDERQEQIISAMSAADLRYDEIDSYDGYLVFREEGGNPYTFTDWHEIVDWINGVVFDDPARNEAAERVLYPERYEQRSESLREWTERIEQEYQAAIAALPEDRQRVVHAMEAVGFRLNVNNQGRFINNAVEFTPIDMDHGYPLSFASWDEAYSWVNDAPFTEVSGLRDEVQSILHPQESGRFPYSVGDTVYLENGKPFIVTEVRDFSIQLQDPTLRYPIFRAESMESFMRLMARYPQPERTVPEPATRMTTETEAIYPAEENGLPYDIVIERLHIEEPEHTPPTNEPAEIQPPAENFRISDDDLGAGGAKAKFRMNMDAINLLKELESEGRQATPDEQEVLSKYVGWGGLADAFDDGKPAWSAEYAELTATLTPEEYEAARASTLNAHYTSPTVIRAIYEAVGNMGFQTGNILEPSMGVGNFFGMLPEEMSASKLYGVELDSITGRIAQQLYPKANITVAGFETTDRKDFYDLAVGNVPFGQYQVNDRAYNKLGFSIHNYFFAKALDQVRPGGVVAFVTSRYTMDAKDSSARKYIAQRADFLGAVRLPNNAFRANAGTNVVSDIIFLQKRDRPIEIDEDWIHLGQNKDDFSINSYFTEHPEMILGNQTSESTQYGHQDFTVTPTEGAVLSEQLHEAVQQIRGTYTEAELPELGEGEVIDTSIPADPDVRNYSYTIVDGDVYYRENSRMVKPELNATAIERVKGMVELRDCVQKLIGQQMDGYIHDTAIQQTQAELNELYDNFTEKYGLINSRGNALVFADDSSYYLLCSLEMLDEDNNLSRKADMFTKRTIKPHEVVTSVDTASEALALSISEKAGVDMAYMSSLTGKSEDELASELRGVIFVDPTNERYVAADEYLSGNVREKLRLAQLALPADPKFQININALTAAQPKDLDASEIEVRLGATWIDKEYIQQFMFETFEPAYYLRRSIEVNYSDFTAEWNISGKSSVGYGDINARMTYGTERVNAYKILEDTLNLRDVRIYDTKTDPDGKERRVLNSKETTLAQQKQQAIKDAFQDWIWKDPDRRQELTQKYNELFNSTRPREYDGQHITFSGINPEIRLREHQLNAVAHILYGGNTLLAHEVGAGKTFEMVAAAMESKRLGLCQKPLFTVPNHLTEQWASEFLRLYPSANILVATKKDFESKSRKKFCARIATGDYDAVIIGHSQFERIPVSQERQERLLQEQIDEITDGLEELKASRAERFTIKSLERTRKGLETKLKKLQDSGRKDDVITFEQLGVDRLYVDEAHNFKNLFLYTKMRNVAGLSTTDAQKSSDMLLKCRYIDEATDGKGIVFATGTPVSNSMTELYTMMRYLQHDTIQRKGLAHFDCWASTFGETQSAIELAPEGTGYRARTRFSKFFNLPELMTLFKEAADIKTSDQLNLPTPTPIYHNVVAQPTEIQESMVQELSERAAKVHAGIVDASVDNMLKITSDGRKLGLDQRVINPDLPDDPGSKVNQCVDNIYRIWDEGQSEKLTQLVFSDLSTPKTAPTKRAAKAAAGNLDSPELHALEQLNQGEDAETPFSVYNDIREKLVSKGVPREQIAFIHEANTEVRKKELFAKVRSGQVRVLIGSTFKMGAGMNVQDRLVALHDLDCPWRPGDLEQRSGRIIRQGNKNPEVHIYRYVTEKTFDSYLWQTVENKQKFISQIMTSKSPVRSCEDVDETALSYAEIKALCAGDDRIKEKMTLDVDVAKLKLMKASHQSQQYRLEDNLLRHFPEQIEKNKGFITGFEADIRTFTEHPHPKDGFAGMEVKGDKLTDKDNAGAAILEACKDAKGLEPVSIGSYRGFAMSLTVEDFGKDYVLTLKGQMTHRVTLGKDAKGNLIRIDNALAAMPERMTNVQNTLDNLYKQVENAKAELGKPFPQEDELKEKSARLAELNIALNIDDRTPIEQLADEPATEKRERSSVIEKLKSFSAQTQGQQHKNHEQEER